LTRPLVIAHRGASGERPENTSSAYALAIAQAADMIEIDLHLTRDGVVVVHHDASLERLGETGEIGGRTAAELALLDAAPGSEAFEHIPTLLDVLDGFADRVEFNLEIKTDASGRPYPGLEERVLAAVEERALLPRMLFSSFSDRVLARLRALSPGARIAVLVSPRARWRMLARARRVEAEAVNPHVGLVTADLVRRIHAAGRKVFPYTEDDPLGMARLLDLGVDGIFTNHPARLRRLIDERTGATGGSAPPHDAARSC
jgi:glycerophosphoryl diester phosphodiesterase